MLSPLGKLPVQEVHAMPRRHEVTFTVPQRPMGNAAILFEVAVDGEDFGDLRIRRGGLDWKPTNAQNRRRLSWQQLAELAIKHGRRVPN